MQRVHTVHPGLRDHLAEHASDRKMPASRDRIQRLIEMFALAIVIASLAATTPGFAVAVVATTATVTPTAVSVATATTTTTTTTAAAVAPTAAPTTTTAAAIVLSPIDLVPAVRHERFDSRMSRTIGAVACALSFVSVVFSLGRPSLDGFLARGGFRIGLFLRAGFALHQHRAQAGRHLQLPHAKGPHHPTMR
ncbi:hypothetical protein [Trinickia acidisoli]|uniref:hypothetical protein n=1 Tax=Trinickia acidisoli TaxID=2767482 RepID=UPI001A8DC6F9|nr:hypothetical protein [Trinickia acidisoli]